MASSAYKASITNYEAAWQCCLYSQSCTGSHFLWLSGPHSESAPSLINRDAYPLMHRDEQSAWQAGSYSFLTPASAEWCNRTAGPLPFLLPCFPLRLSQSPPCTLPRSLLLPCLLFLTHSLSSLFSFLSLPPSPLYFYLLAPSLSPSPFQRAMFPCLHYTQLLPSINYLPTPL